MASGAETLHFQVDLPGLAHVLGAPHPGGMLLRLVGVKDHRLGVGRDDHLDAQVIPPRSWSFAWQLGHVSLSDPMTSALPSGPQAGP